MEEGSILIGSKILGRLTLKGVETCKQVIVRGRAHVGMLERVEEIGIESSKMVEGGGYPNS